MNPLAYLLVKKRCAFHLRLGGCGGCSAVVDAALRDRCRGRPLLVECPSPRQADLLIVSGSWSEGLIRPALKVLMQAPTGTSVVLAGDCARSRGEVADRLGLMLPPAELEVAAAVGGCPLEVESLLEGVRGGPR